MRIGIVRALVGLSLAVVMAARAPGAAGMQVVQVGPDIACETCALKVSRAVTLGGLDGPGVGNTRTALVDREGRILLHHDMLPHELGVFDRGGKYLRGIGRRGDGPGEFRFIMTAAIGAGDSIHVFDSELARETVLTPSLELAATHRLPGAVREVVLLSDGRLVVQARISTSDLIGLPLHLLDSERELIRSFGSEDEIVRPDMPILGLRRIAGAGDGAVWSAYLNEYRIERWRLDGTKDLQVMRSPDWFKTWYFMPARSLDEPPPPMISAVREDERGRLWVLIRVAGENWRDGLEARSGAEGPGVGIADWDALYDTIVEVIDPAAGILVHSRRVAPYLMGFNNVGMGIGYREGRDGVPYIDLWELELQGDGDPE